MLRRLYATIANLPSPMSGIAPRINVLGTPLQPVPVGQGPPTGWMRNNLCDASAADPASHTVAAIITPAFLKFSASRGNDLSSLWPVTGPLSPASPTNTCTWCLCATRWKEALLASKDHPDGDRIVPKVLMESTHVEALKKVSKEDLERFAVCADQPFKNQAGGLM